MADSPERAATRKSAGRKGGYNRMANMTPEERAALGKKAGAASAEAARKRRAGLEALRAALKAQGWTDEQIEAEYGIKKPARSSRQYASLRPSAEELDPYLREVDEEFPEGLTYDQRVREATLRLKRDRARAIEDGLR
ncbi:hypothetical protein [Curtobacterium sp. MCPF17_051]|uniref:hypothetical protein n=1 Tax=Curtobacterium sp. MCPF17_051 TaxID=2175640 RepID=UPI000DA76693|nr:hypothetical protein [Curtobacterium sp. MCPF17_051]PZF29124.1 hypothetical protein DEJ35_11270 [Curtobacterium sp. MCPF17_051]